MSGENYINHIVLVLDASSSMQHLESQVIKVADAQVAYLAQRSKELDQETKITVYAFSDTSKCLVYDKDVLRLPSMSGLYKTYGNTALLDATGKALDDLAKTPEIYGDHAFLVYVLTDGQENASRTYKLNFTQKINSLPDHWTVAVLVPDQRGVYEAKKFGFPANNIAVWDATSVQGVIEVGETIRRSTDQFMQARATGVRNFRSTGIFQLDINNLNVNKLDKMNSNYYHFINVPHDIRIDDLVKMNFGSYQTGSGFYQLTKTEEIQPQKEICIVDKHSLDVYYGHAARQMLGLPNDTVKVSNTFHPKYDIFVQSTSQNRKLIGGTRLLVLTR